MSKKQLTGIAVMALVAAVVVWASNNVDMVEEYIG